MMGRRWLGRLMGSGFVDRALALYGYLSLVIGGVGWGGGVVLVVRVKMVRSTGDRGVACLF